MCRRLNTPGDSFVAEVGRSLLLVQWSTGWVSISPHNGRAAMFSSDCVQISNRAKLPEPVVRLHTSAAAMENVDTRTPLPPLGE
jgi:hypothetical protein